MKHDQQLHNCLLNDTQQLLVQIFFGFTATRSNSMLFALILLYTFSCVTRYCTMAWVAFSSVLGDVTSKA